MIHDVVIEEKRYTGENASRDSFKIIGAYTNYRDAYMAAKKQLVSTPLVTGRDMINCFVYGVDVVVVGQVTTNNCQTTINVYRIKED